MFKSKDELEKMSIEQLVIYREEFIESYEQEMSLYEFFPDDSLEELHKEELEEIEEIIVQKRIKRWKEKL